MTTITPEMRAVMAETMAALNRGELAPPRVPWEWEGRRRGEMTPEYLGRVLEWAGVPDLAERARLGHFDDFHAPAEVADGFELVRLVTLLRSASGQPERLAAIENAVRHGEFDATAAESDRWAVSKDGQETFASLAADSVVLDEFRGTGRNDPCPCGSGVKFKRCHGR